MIHYYFPSWNQPWCMAEVTRAKTRQIFGWCASLFLSLGFWPKSFKDVSIASQKVYFCFNLSGKQKEERLSLVWTQLTLRELLQHMKASHYNKYPRSYQQKIKRNSKTTNMAKKSKTELDFIRLIILKWFKNHFTFVFVILQITNLHWNELVDLNIKRNDKEQAQKLQIKMA